MIGRIETGRRSRHRGGVDPKVFRSTSFAKA